MEKNRSKNDDFNEHYYDEMLFKAEFGVAAGICDKLGQTQKAQNYRKLEALLNIKS